MQSLTKVSDAENIGHSDLHLIYLCSTVLIKMYQHIKFDDCGTYSIREMELNANYNQLHAKSNQLVKQKI